MIPDVLVVHGDYPRSKCWDDLVDYAKSLGHKLDGVGISIFDEMKSIVAASANKSQAAICSEWVAQGFPCAFQNGFACSKNACTPMDKEERRKRAAMR